MNLYHLRYFSVLAETENYTKAAKLLSITQPSLSNAIHSLEQEIKVKLFAKKGRNIYLTKSGKLFVTEVNKALTTLDQGISEVQKSNQHDTLIRIATLRTLSTQWLPNTVHDFLATNQKTQIHFEFSTDTGLSPDIIHGLRTEKYDICFCSKVDDQEDIDYFPIAEQELVVITPNNHPLAAKKEINLAETLPYKQITFSTRSGLYSIMRQLFAECGGHPTSVYSIEEDQAVAGLVANNFGIAVVPNMTILKSMPIKIIPLTFPKWKRVFYMATLKQHYKTPAVKHFVDFIKEQN
ncbi:LysR family transcriptional regulator [Loigolactobacillus backii]|uniref:LysR family transcriptional regulator n=1 Tax=Loigolactobacillus backii TaxID=375175 RepID=UPI0007F11490|nr:LysR family transcriptional regulator [Loigolactobacillus backii]ANK65436.1 LysR family transcriptional regulator [Loigolactobacillus backii]